MRKQTEYLEYIDGHYGYSGLVEDPLLSKTIGEMQALDDLDEKDDGLVMWIKEQQRRIRVNLQNMSMDNLRTNPEESSLLKGVTIDGNKMAYGSTKFNIAKRWSKDFVHGADCLLPATALVELILHPNETIRKVSSINWHCLIQNNMYIKVYDAEEDVDFDNSRFSLDGGFTTSKGRELKFVGIQNVDDRVETSQDEINYYLRWLFYVCRINAWSGMDDTDTFSFSKAWKPIQDIARKEMLALPSVSAATMIDILSHFLLIVAGREFGCKYNLLGGLGNLVLPGDTYKYLSGNFNLKIKFLKDKMHRGKSGFDLIPFTARFSGQEEDTRGVFAVTDELPH